MKVSVLSDIHIDSWVDPYLPLPQQTHLINELIVRMLPDELTDVVVIAGDIGHYNAQNKLLFELLKQHYKHIIWTHGNHDIYLIDYEIMNDYNFNSFSRLDEMKMLASEIPDVHYLDGNIVEINGKTFGGCGMWYSDEYAIQVWGKSPEWVRARWVTFMNDFRLIREIGKPFNFIDYCISQYAILESVYEKCDVVITHVPPDWSNLVAHYKIPETTFFTFDGSKMLNNMDSTKTWIYGHTHDVYNYKHKNGCHMVCNPFDYGKGDIRWVSDVTTKIRKIINIEV